MGRALRTSMCSPSLGEAGARARLALRPPAVAPSVGQVVRGGGFQPISDGPQCKLESCTVPKILRIVLLSIASLAGLIVTLVVISAIALFVLLKPSRDEVVRSVSPDGQVVATVTEINGGATTSFAYEVDISRPGATFGADEVATFYGAARSPTAYGVDLRWLSATDLKIEYWDARSANLKRPTFRVGGHDVQVELVPRTLNAAAPDGGMLFNKQHGRGSE
jgi:hypothetical protein